MKCLIGFNCSMCVVGMPGLWAILSITIKYVGTMAAPTNRRDKSTYSRCGRMVVGTFSAFFGNDALTNRRWLISSHEVRARCSS